MKYRFIFLGIICLIVLIILFGLEITFELSEMREQSRIEKIQNEKKIEELEKEIRIMKQDILILEYGYEYEEK